MELKCSYKSEKIEKKLNKGTIMNDIDNRADRYVDRNRLITVINCCYIVIKIVFNPFIPNGAYMKANGKWRYRLRYWAHDS